MMEGVLPNTDVKILTPHVVIFLDEAFGGNWILRVEHS